jgi:hypothetical protein
MRLTTRAGMAKLRIVDPQPEKKPKVARPDAAEEKSEQKQELTPEEQMARFEEDLKESDWGHQPC